MEIESRGQDRTEGSLPDVKKDVKKKREGMGEECEREREGLYFYIVEEYFRPIYFSKITFSNGNTIVTNNNSYTY